MSGRAPKPCGTRAAYQRHLRRGETPDEACTAAKRAYDRERSHARGARPRRDAPCGTAAGFERHRRRYETPCQACRDALRLYQAQYKARRLGRPAPTSLPPRREPLPCGTNAGYHRHWRRGQKPCAACTAARSAYAKTWRENRAKRTTRGVRGEERSASDRPQRPRPVRALIPGRVAGALEYDPDTNPRQERSR